MQRYARSWRDGASGCCEGVGGEWNRCEKGGGEEEGEAGCMSQPCSLFLPVFVYFLSFLLTLLAFRLLQLACTLHGSRGCGSFAAEEGVSQLHEWVDKSELTWL